MFLSQFNEYQSLKIYKGTYLIDKNQSKYVHQTNLHNNTAFLTITKLYTKNVFH